MAKRHKQLVTVVFSDSHHTLHFVQLRLNVEPDDAGFSPRVNLKLAEKQATDRVRERSITRANDWQMVGVLVATLEGERKGTIQWANDFSGATHVSEV